MGKQIALTVAATILVLAVIYNVAPASVTKYLAPKAA